MKPTLPFCPSRQMMSRLVLFSLIFLGIGRTAGFAQTIFNYTNDSDGDPFFVALNASGTALTPGGGVVPDPCGAAEGYGTEGWPATNIWNVDDFNASGDFVEFTITPDAGFGLKITGFSARSRRENLTPGTAPDGPLAIRYAYSIGGDPWIWVNPGNPQSSNLCATAGVLRAWPAASFPINTSSPITFRLYGLSSGTAGTGDLFFRNVVVTGEVCDNAPDVILADDTKEVCRGNIASALNYSGTDASTYSIDYDAAANTAGFVDQGLIMHLNLPSVPAGMVGLTIPAGAAPGVYNGTFTVYNTCGFSTSVPFTVEIWALPTGVLSGTQTICTGAEATLSAALTGASPWTLTLSNGGGTFVTPDPVVVEPTGATTYTITALTDNNGCTAVPTGLTGNATVSLHQAALFGFSAASTSHPIPVAGNNNNDPSSIAVNMCAGDMLLLSAYSDNGLPTGDIGYTGYFTTSNNILFDGNPLPAGPINGTVVPSAAEGFFTSSYGPYTLSSGSSGTITQVFIPFLDVNDNDAYDDGIDCPGNPITLNYFIQGIPDVDGEADVTACAGSTVEVNFSGAIPNTIFEWVNTNANIGLAASGAGSLSFTATNSGVSNLTGTITVTPKINGCVGDEEEFDITVIPNPIFGFAASTDSDPAETGDNDPSTPLLDNNITVDFCSGDNLTLASLTENVAIGYLGSYTSTGNINADGGLIGTGPVNFDVLPNDVSFFNNTYGGALGYSLANGTYGQVIQVFTPYVDVNGSNSYDVGDCLGEPVTLTYNVYAPIVITAVRNDNDLCSGELVNYTISTASTENVTFKITLSENPGGGSFADLDDDNTLPVVVTITDANNFNASNPYNFTQVINNATGLFERGRVLLTISDVKYADSEVSCANLISNPLANTTIYPKPRLVDPADKFVCTGNSADLDLDLQGWVSPGSASAGYPVRIDWTAVGTNVTVPATGSATIYLATGAEATINDITDVLTLVDPMMNGSVTYTITPRASGPTNGFNTDDCTGDPITVTITVVKPAVPTIAGASTVHLGSQVQLTGTNGVLPPASFVSAVWAPSVNPVATVDNTGLVTGVGVGGPITITYTVTDNAGCVSTAMHSMSTIEPLTLSTVAVGSSSVSCGGEVDLQVTATNLSDMGSFNFNINWDETKFELVTFTPVAIGGSMPFIDQSGVANGDLVYSWFDGVAPFAATVAPGTVIFTYRLRAIGSAGASNVDLSGLPIPIEAYNGSFYPVPVTLTGASLLIEPLGLTLSGNPSVCPSETLAHLEFNSVQGNPNHFLIDFDNCPLFPDTYEGDFNVQDGEILIPLPNGLQSGSCSATLVVSNEDYDCESGLIYFSIVIDQTLPTASAPDPLNLVCIADIPAPNVLLIDDEDDNCTDPEDLIVAYEPFFSSQSGTGCGNDPKVINRVYSITDEAGNTRYVTHVITVLDNVGPTVNLGTLAPWYSTTTAAEAAVIAKANLTKQDNCSPPATITVAINTPTTVIGCSATVHLIVTDACGNPTLVNYTTTVDNQAPVITNPGPLDDCYNESDDPFSQHYPYQDAVDAAISAVRAAASDNCTNAMDLEITAATTGTDCALNIIVTVKDACGHASTYTYVTRVESDIPFILSDPEALEGECFDTEQEAIDAAIDATIAGDDCTSPNDLQYDVYILGGCPAEILVVVTDYCGNPNSITYTGVHIDTEDPEVNPATYSICYKTLAQAYAALAIAANPSDNCTEEADLIASAMGSAVEVAPLNDGCKEYEITLTFKDNCGNDLAFTFPDYFVIDNIAPTAQALPALTYSCVSEIDEPDVNLVIALDNCGVEDIVHLSDVLPTSCPGTGTRTYRVYDCAGNYKDVIQSITINDNILPTFTSDAEELDRICPCGDQQCLTAALDLTPAVEDNCGEPSLVLVSDDYVGGCTGQRVRVWRAYDDCGNSSLATFTQTIRIVDTEGPTWLTYNNQLDGYSECSDVNYLAYLMNLVPEAEDACNFASVAQVDQEFVYYNVCNSYLGYYLTTFVATDLCGNESDPFYQYIYVYDITPPVLSATVSLDKVISCDDSQGLAYAQSLEPTVTETCTNATLVKIPGNFTPGDCTQEGSYTNYWYAYDECGNYSQYFTQVITIVDQTAPAWTTLPGDLNVTLECGDENSLLYYQSMAPAALDICDPTILIEKQAGVLVPNNCPNTGTITNTWTATDGCGNVSTAYTQVINIVDYTPPSLFCDEPNSIDDCYASVAAAEAAAKAAVIPCDNCTADEDLVVTAVTYGDLCYAAIMVTVTDCAGNQNYTYFYTRIDNTKPTMVVSNIGTCFSSQAAALAAAYQGTTISDNCDGLQDLDISTQITGVCPGMIITITATDQCGNFNTVTYNGICIDGAPPVITTPASGMAAVCSPNLQSDFQTWINNHGGAIATGGSSWYTIPATPSLAGGCNGGTSVTFVVTDNCGNTASTQATFTFTDNTPPTASNLPPINVSCINAIPAPDPALVTNEADNCDATPTVAWFADAVGTGTGCANSPRIIGRTYSVTDDCGNTTYVTQTITAVDNVAPTFSAPANITISVDANCIYNALPAITGDVTNESDNCSNSLNAVYTDLVAPGSGNPNKFVITRTWTLVDGCGNSAIPRTQIITVQDVTAPTLTCPANVTVAGGLIQEYPCAAVFTTLGASGVNDNCDGEVLTYSLSGFFAGAATGTGNITNTKVFTEGATTVTYTVTDAVGNATTCSFSVTVNCLSISGRIIWEHDDVSGVKDADVKLSQGMMPLGNNLSIANGNYTLTAPGPGLYRVTPEKNINRLNGVTSADATRILNHVNFSNPIVDPYKKVCADVNRSNVITNIDAQLITQCLAGSPSAEASFSVFWRFVPTSFVMPATAHQVVPVFDEFKDVNLGMLDAVGVDFFGMKIGDVEAEWANPQNVASPDPLVWVVQDQTLVAGTEVDLTFAASNFNDLAAYQMGLDFDPTQLQFVGFQPLDAIPMNLLDNFGAYHANLGTLRNVWSTSNGTTLSEGAPVFRAKFKVLVGGQKLSQVLKLDDSEIPCKAFSGALQPTEVRLVFTESVDTETPLDLGNAQLQLMQNRPNPFSDVTTIGFVLPEACEAHIRILDISGRELTSYDRKYTAGYHELDFRMENAASYGMLFCELLTPQGKRTIKMMTAK